MAHGFAAIAKLRMLLPTMAMLGADLLVAQGPPVPLSVDAKPLLNLPVEQDKPFGRVLSAVRLSDGAIVVADDSERLIRFFRSSGVEYASVGGRGGGPGEFGLLASMEQCGRDTILAFDAEHSRATVLTGKGQVSRTFRVLAGDSKLAYKVVCNGGRSLLVLGWPRLVRNVPLGPYRDSLTIYLADLSGRNLRALGQFQADERYRHERGDGLRIFGKQLVVSGTGDRILVGDGSSYSITVLRPTGEVISTVRKRTQQVPVRAAEIDRFVAEYLPLVRDPAARESQRRGFKEYEFPSHYPPYSNLALDPGGNIWIRDFRTPTQTRETWSVFSPTGRLFGEVVMPPFLEVLDIGTDYLVGRVIGDDGAHRIAVHRLRSNLQ